MPHKYNWKALTPVGPEFYFIILRTKRIPSNSIPIKNSSNMHSANGTVLLLLLLLFVVIAAGQG